MNKRELEMLEKKSLYTKRINSDLKDSVINDYLNEITKLVKRESKKKEVLVFVMSIDSTTK